MKEVYLTGVCQWAKIQAPATKYKSEEKEYSIQMHLDEEAWDLFEKVGLRLKIKEGEELGKHVTFKCAEAKADGTLLPKPTVLLKGVNTNELVGNGSKVTCKILVFDTEFGVGHRLLAVNVLDLVEYVQAEVEVYGTPFE